MSAGEMGILAHQVFTFCLAQSIKLRVADWVSMHVDTETRTILKHFLKRSSGTNVFPYIWAVLYLFSEIYSENFFLDYRNKFRNFYSINLTISDHKFLGK